VARAAVPALGAGYLAALLAADHFASFHEQLALGALTWLVLAAALRRFPLERRVQALGVVVFATIGEIVGSLVWGVYSYRLGNLPMFVPPAHGIVFLSGLALRDALRRHERALVWAAGLAAASWALLGLTVLPQRDVAGALAVLILLVFLRRSRSRSIYAGVFLVVAALELYGTAIGHLALGGGRARHRRPRRQPAERCRGRLHLVRRDGAPRRPVAAPLRRQAPKERTDHVGVGDDLLIHD